MNLYDKTIERLYNTGNFFGPKLGLQNVNRLDEALGYPRRNYPCIHVAGSNGKGSVATKIAKALEFSGYRAGLYTSPHLYSFRERICVNSALISEKEVVKGMETIFAIVDACPIPATFFEMTTFLAFEHFRKSNVDVAIFEAGLGGRLDATNVIHPILSVITSISREHVEILGSTLEEIAFEKAGIIKQEVPVVLGPYARFRAIEEKCATERAQIFYSQEKSCFFDEENSAIAQLALGQLQLRFPNLSEESMAEALKMRPPCRFEKMGNILFDVAHNPDALAHLIASFDYHFPNRRLRVIFGLSKDKDIAGCLFEVKKRAGHIHLVAAASPRSAQPELLAMELKRQGFAHFTCHTSIFEGMIDAAEMSILKEEMLLVCGSFFIMAEAKKALGLNYLYDPLDLNEKTLSGGLSISKT